MSLRRNSLKRVGRNQENMISWTTRLLFQEDGVKYD